MGDCYYPGLWKRVMEHPENSFSEEGLTSAIFRLLESNANAVIVDASSPMYELAVSTGYCNWGFLEDRFFRNNWAFPLQKGSPFVSTFNYVWENIQSTLCSKSIFWLKLQVCKACLKFIDKTSCYYLPTNHDKNWNTHRNHSYHTPVHSEIWYRQ